MSAAARKSKKRGGSVELGDAELVSGAIVELLKPFAVNVKTLTFDNGKEFAWHEKIDAELSGTSFFPRPYASWQRGSNENFNGLLRQYIPKKRSMEDITDEEISMIEQRLNNRQRKRFGFKTPSDVFYQSFNRVALAA